MPRQLLPQSMNHIPQRVRQSLWLRPLAVLALLGATTLGACRSDDAIRASFQVRSDTLVAYAMSGTVIQSPVGLNTIDAATLPISGGTTFDIAFDFEAANPSEITVLPARLITSPVLGAPMVGLFVADESFEDLLRAPDTYYRPDTAITVSPGQAFVVQTFRISTVAPAPICYYLVSPRVYSKVVIDSVNLTTRAIHLRQTVDPNCGYRSFEPGLPAN